MKTRHFSLLFLITAVCIVLFNSNCSNSKTDSKKEKAAESPYLNHHDSAKYVGINTCKTCHANIYETFIETGMGQSFDRASKLKTAALFGKGYTVYDSISDFHYYPFFSADTMKVMEFRLSGKDTIYKRLETVNYIIGSGQHTNSHMMLRDGFITQMPITFYTQKKQWDVPPGFENGHNTRFSRKIGLECMSCHNSYPDFEIGSENKFAALPNGIGCERCHGPGSIHVQQKSLGQLVDTSKYIDFSIVNPGKLSPDLQFDVCQRCHLQGNAVLKNNHSFYDFKPGMKLSDFMTVFLPKYKNADDEFIMASHADRLKQSQCFIKSQHTNEHTDDLHPYKSSFTCVTCHNPHKSVKTEKDEFFNAKCNSCHASDKKMLCSEQANILKKANNNCVSCHMPRSGAIDIPHVTVHDHYIRKPKASTKKVSEAKEFLGLFAINETNPDHSTKAQAYINQYEKFENKIMYLDSAGFYINLLQQKNDINNLSTIVQYYFLRENYTQLLATVNTFDQNKLLTKVLVNKSYNNADAWLCYRIAEAYTYTGNSATALPYYKKANELAPLVPDFLNKLGSAQLITKNTAAANEIFKKLTTQFSNYAPGWNNFGYLQMMIGQNEIALKYINKALALDPDYELALMNKASILLMQNDIKNAKLILLKITKKYPNNAKAKEVLQQLNAI